MPSGLGWELREQLTAMRRQLAAGTRASGCTGLAPEGLELTSWLRPVPMPGRQGLQAVAFLGARVGRVDQGHTTL
jgi:hypothetical protein